MASHNNTYYIHTFGCQMNVRESEVAEGVLQDLGYQRAQSIDEADVILFNTCCIRDLAEKKAWGAIGATKAKKQHNPSVVVGVFGCLMAQRGMSEELKSRFPFVDFCFGTNSIHQLPMMLQLAKKGDRSYQSEIGDAGLEFGIPVHHQQPPLAYVNIIHGCNNFCTYCIVPHVRGREQSRAADDIVREVDGLVAKGYREVMLLGQNVNSYGTDNLGIGFADLLRRLDRTGIARIRFMTSHPKDLSDALIAAMADCEHVCNQIHLPVQSGSDGILSRMNRKYSSFHYRTLIQKLRMAMPDCGITTDLIAGFPGETQEDHNASIGLINDVHFDAAFVFAFSPRKGTPAASMPDQIHADVKKQRLSELLFAQAQSTMALHKSLVGSAQVVLVEGTSKKDAAHVSGRMERGRTVNFTGDSSLLGELVPVIITKAKVNSLFAERL